VLVDGDDGFELADPEATRAAVGQDAATADGADVDADEVEETSWSVYDKGAAGVTMAFFVAYAWQPLRDLIGGVMDIALGPLEQALPFYAVVMILAMGTGLYSTLLQANLMNTEKMGQYQAQMQDLQDRREKAKERDDQEALDRLQDEQMEMMGDQLGMFKEQFRPMVWIMFFTIPVFLWMYWALGIGGGVQHIDPEAITIPLRGPLEWRDAALGPVQVWILWYFVCSMGFTQIIRKGLNIDISPSPS
jgi:Predicted membrane protein